MILNLEVYKNSLLHKGNDKTVHMDNECIEIHTTLLDTRFITFTDLDKLKRVLPYCRTKYLDKILDSYIFFIFS